MNRRDFLSFLGLSGLFPSIARAKPASVFTPSGVIPAGAKSGISAETATESWPRITLVGCGNAGIAMCKTIDKARYGLHKIIAIDTSRRSLIAASNVDQKFLIANTHGKKPKVATDAYLCALEECDAIRNTIGDSHLLITVCGLGGAAGAGIANALGRLEFGHAPYRFAFATLPFGFECNNRQREADMALQALLESKQGVCCYSHALMASATSENTAFSDSFDQAGMALGAYLWNAAGCLTRYGLVGVDLEDVRTVMLPKALHTNQLPSSIGWGTAQGVNRASIASLNALNHPALNSRKGVANAGVSVSIRASAESLRFKEVNAIMKTIRNTVATPGADIIFSADFDETLGQSLQVSIVLTPCQRQFYV